MKGPARLLILISSFSVPFLVVASLFKHGKIFPRLIDAYRQWVMIRLSVRRWLGAFPSMIGAETGNIFIVPFETLPQLFRASRRCFP
jgi:hypothetical protein